MPRAGLFHSQPILPQPRLHNRAFRTKYNGTQYSDKLLLYLLFSSRVVLEYR